MNGIYGFNTRVIGVSRDMIMSAAHRTGGAFMLCHNDPDLVREANAAGIQTIYRQSENESLESLDSFQFVQTRAEKGAAYVHLTNEVDPSPLLHKKTREMLEAATALSVKAVAYNFGTHAGRWQFDQARDNLAYAVKHGHALGIHLYPDEVHDSTLKEWLDVKRSLGIFTICTEFGYLRDYRDPYSGWRNRLGADERHEFLRKWIPFFYEEQIPVCTFCFDPWDQPNVEYAKAEGLGFWDYEDVLNTMQSLNQFFIFKGVKLMPVAIEHVDPPTTGGVRGAVVSMPSQFVNFRAEPTSASADQGDLHKDELVTYFDDDVNGWVYVIRETPSAKGWVSLQNGGVQFVPELLPDPPPAPTSKEVTIKLYGATQAQRDQFAAHLRTVLEALDQLNSVSGIQVEVD